MAKLGTKRVIIYLSCDHYQSRQNGQVWTFYNISQYQLNQEILKKCVAIHFSYQKLIKILIFKTAIYTTVN